MKTQTVFKSTQGREAILAVYDRILQRWPVPYQTQIVPTRHGETFVLTCGDANAPALVLLHGSSANSAMWIGDAAAYSAAYHVVAIDLPGEAGKSEPVRSALHGPSYTEWLCDVLAAMRLERVTMLGISLGGWMALKLATRFPERLEKLVLLCPGGVVPINRSFMLKAIPYSFLGKLGSEKVYRRVNAGLPLAKETLQYIQLINTHFTPRLEALPLFSDEELQRLTMPVFHLAGAKDPLMDAQKTRARLNGVLSRFSGEILPEAGHVLANMAPHVMPFLQKDEMIRV